MVLRMHHGGESCGVEMVRFCDGRGKKEDSILSSSLVGAMKEISYSTFN